MGSGAGLLGTDSLSPSTCCVTPGGFWETLSIRTLCSGLSGCRGAGKAGWCGGGMAWGGASLPARVLSEVGRHARAGTLGLHNADGPRGSTLEVMLCREDSEQQPSQSPKDWLATTPGLWGSARLWPRWLQGAGYQGPRSPCFGPQALQLRRSLVSCVTTWEAVAWFGKAPREGTRRWMGLFQDF